MINYPLKKIVGLLGAPRAGKDQVANFLTETRGYVQLAFADQIKKEFGVSKEDFEAAKIAGNIEELRDRLWAFSAKKKQQDPFYFINKVVDYALASPSSVVITDIRTKEELLTIEQINKHATIYWVTGQCNSFKDDYLAGSKLKKTDILDRFQSGNNYYRIISNENNGLYSFYKYLDRYFFYEDIVDINQKLGFDELIVYAEQFDIRQKD
jgi:hypothetical protein